MATINVAIPFKLSFPTVNDDGTPRSPALPHTYVFPTPGTYDANDEVVNHWFTAPHLEGYVAPRPAEAMGVEVMVPAAPPPPPPEGGDTTGGAARGGQSRGPETRREETKR